MSQPNLDLVFTAHSELRTVLFLALCATFGFVYETSQEPLNGFMLNSHGIRAWSLTRTSLKVKVMITRDKKQHFRPFRRPVSGLCLIKHL